MQDKDAAAHAAEMEAMAKKSSEEKQACIEMCNSAHKRDICELKSKHESELDDVNTRLADAEVHHSVQQHSSSFYHIPFACSLCLCSLLPETRRSYA